jgi:hypothetical protein
VVSIMMGGSAMQSTTEEPSVPVKLCGKSRYLTEKCDCPHILIANYDDEFRCTEVTVCGNKSFELL